MWGMGWEVLGLGRSTHFVLVLQACLPLSFVLIKLPPRLWAETKLKGFCFSSFVVYMYINKEEESKYQLQSSV